MSHYCFFSNDISNLAPSRQPPRLKVLGNLSSGQDGGVGRYAPLPRTAKRRITTNLKMENQPELPENQTAWKYNNQEVKEDAFIHTGALR